eukprot:3941965-Rhodomonas_salina.3
MAQLVDLYRIRPTTCPNQSKSSAIWSSICTTTAEIRSNLSNSGTLFEPRDRFPSRWRENLRVCVLCLCVCVVPGVGSDRGRRQPPHQPAHVSELSVSVCVCVCVCVCVHGRGRVRACIRVCLPVSESVSVSAYPCLSLARKPTEMAVSLCRRASFEDRNSECAHPAATDTICQCIPGPAVSQAFQVDG